MALQPAHGAGKAPGEVTSMNGFLALPPQPPADEELSAMRQQEA